MNGKDYPARDYRTNDGEKDAGIGVALEEKPISRKGAKKFDNKPRARLQGEGETG
ncbi:MAG: hypothetical protein WBO37_04005 [Gammaproteobacteria bacterium]